MKSCRTIVSDIFSRQGSTNALNKKGSVGAATGKDSRGQHGKGGPSYSSIGNDYRGGNRGASGSRSAGGGAPGRVTNALFKLFLN